MRVPAHKQLETWIQELIETDTLYRFYKTQDWLDLRRQVMEDHHNECEMHADRGKYKRAQTVHHEFEVKHHPSMALTRYITQPDGSKREVLHPLCNQCHNDVHGRMRRNPSRPPITEERW